MTPIGIGGESKEKGGGDSLYRRAFYARVEVTTNRYHEQFNNHGKPTIQKRISRPTACSFSPEPIDPNEHGDN